MAKAKKQYKPSPFEVKLREWEASYEIPAGASIKGKRKLMKLKVLGFLRLDQAAVLENGRLWPATLGGYGDDLDWLDYAIELTEEAEALGLSSLVQLLNTFTTLLHGCLLPEEVPADDSEDVSVAIQ